MASDHILTLLAVLPDVLAVLAGRRRVDRGGPGELRLRGRPQRRGDPSWLRSLGLGGLVVEGDGLSLQRVGSGTLRRRKCKNVTSR